MSIQIIILKTVRISETKLDFKSNNYLFCDILFYYKICVWANVIAHFGINAANTYA